MSGSLDLRQNVVLGQLKQVIVRTLKSGATWVRHHPGMTAALAANLVMVFLPFYDANNIPLELSFASHLNGATPAFSFYSWVAGPYILALFEPSFLGYLASGYSLYWSYTTLKVIYFLLTISLAYALWTAIASHSRLVANGAAIFTLANPAWYMVNYIWVEYDIFPVVFLTVGYVILRYSQKSDRPRLTILVAAACITTSIFFYWFAAAVVPALIYYTSQGRDRVRLLAYLSGISVALVLVMVFLLSGGLGHFSATLLGGSSAINRSDYFGFQYFVKLSAYQYLLVALDIAILVPLFLRSLGVGESAAIFVTLSLVVFTSAIPMPDNYIVVFPFAVLALLRSRSLRVPWARLWGSLAYGLAGLLLINVVIFNAQPDGVGVFFFGYSIFGRNIQFVTTAAGLALFYRLFNYTIAAALVLSIAIIVADDFVRRPRPGGLESAGSTDGSVRARNLAVRRIKVDRRRPALFGAVVIGLLIVGGLLFNATLSNVVHYEGRGSAPTYELMPTFLPPNGNVVRPIPGQTYLQDGATYRIFPAAPAFEFGRWFSGQDVSFDSQVGLSGQVPSLTPILSGDPFNVSMLNLTEPDASSAAVLTPSATDNVTSAGSAPFPLMGRSGDLYRLDGNSTLLYQLNASEWTGTYLGFAFNVSAFAPSGTNVLHFQGPHGFAAVVAYPSETVLVFAGSLTGDVFVESPIPLVLVTHAWYYLVVHIISDGLLIDLSGATTSINGSLFPSGTVDLRLGEPFATAGPNGSLAGSDFSLRGETTALYSGVQPWPLRPSFVAQVSTSFESVAIPLDALSAELSLSSEGRTSAIDVENHNLTATTPTTELWFGKLIPGNYGVEITVHRLVITSSVPDQFGLVPVFWLMIIPYGVLAMAVRRLGRGRSP